MQLFLIAPAIVYLMYRFKMRMIVILVALTAICVGYTVALHVQHELTSL